MTDPTTTVDQPTEPPPATTGGMSPVLILGILGILGVIALGVIIVVLLVASSPGPTLTVVPTSALPGTVVRVTGTGFVPNEAVSISAGTQAVGSATADSGGGFAVDVTIPASAAGPSEIAAQGQGSEEPVTVAFAILDPTPQPPTGTRGPIVFETIPPLIVDVPILIPIDGVIDVDIGRIDTIGGDLRFEVLSPTESRLAPVEGALVVNVGDVSPGIEGCVQAAMETAPVALAPEPEGDFYCVQTNDRNVAEVQILSRTDQGIEVQIRTYGQ